MTNSPTHIPVRPEWLATHDEEVLEPSIPVVDSHHHLYDRPDMRYLLDDYLLDLNSGHDVRASVFVQARAMLRADAPSQLQSIGETEFVNGVAAISASGIYGEARVCAGIVGHADLMLGDAVRPVLERHLAAAGGSIDDGGRFCGIRQSLTWDPDPWFVNAAYPTSEHMTDAPEFRRGFAHLAPLQLSFEAWAFFHQLSNVAALARAFPDTRIVLNHCGGVIGIGNYSRQRSDVFRRWSEGLSELARCPNVMVKLSGLGMRLGGFGFEDKECAPTSIELADAWRPWIDGCIEAFGPRRCMYGSNFPVDKGSYSYQSGLNALKRIVSAASLEEKDDIFWRTAKKFYRLPGPDYTHVASTVLLEKSMTVDNRNNPGTTSARAADTVSSSDLSSILSDDKVHARLRDAAPTTYAAADRFWRTGFSANALSPRMKELVLLALHATVTSLHGDGIRRHVARALAAGATEQDVLDVLITIVGIANHALYFAIPFLQRELEAAGQSAELPPLTAEVQAIKDEFVRVRGYWNEQRDVLVRLMPDYFASLAQLSADPWVNGSLTDKERELVCVAIDCTVTHMYEPGLKIHIRQALKKGASRDEILAVFHLAALTGLEGYIAGAEAMYATAPR